jgi:serine/threonine protein kinase
MENILLTQKNHIKLADFGLAIDLEKERAVTRAGTLDYMAPEVLRCPFKMFPEENKHRDDLRYDFSVDVWAVGVLTYELVTGVAPFASSDPEEVAANIQAGVVEFPNSMSVACREFVSMALRSHPGDRPTAAAMEKFAFIRGYQRCSSQPALASLGSKAAPPLHTAVQHSISSCSTSQDPSATTATPTATPTASARIIDDDVLCNMSIREIDSLLEQLLTAKTAAEADTP